MIRTPFTARRAIVSTKRKPNPMKRNVLVIIWCCVVLMLACSRSRGGTEGSDTNWLRMCDDDTDCGELSCLCGVCTVECETASDCSGASQTLVCRMSASLASCTEHATQPATLCERDCAPGDACTTADADSAPPRTTSPGRDGGAPLGQDVLDRDTGGVGSTSTESAVCGDGVLSDGERCDDGNVETGDGCDDECSIEPGYVCGDGTKAPTEACDDGNQVPFDGCSERCRIEPRCEGSTCTTRCGDGLVVGEECDDGNTDDGDGCSSTCQREAGYECRLEPVCSEKDGVCTLSLSAIHRDFPNHHPDFATPCTDGEGLGLVAQSLDARGFPVLSEQWEPGSGCIESESRFVEWYDDEAAIGSVKATFTLYEDEPPESAGVFGAGYFNRFGSNGERFQRVENPDDDLTPYGTSLEECAQTCEQNVCDQACTWDGIVTAQQALEAAEGRGAGDEELDELQEAVDAAQATRAACVTSCPVETASEVAECAAECKPCGGSAGSVQWCVGGDLVSTYGSPLFFPVDGLFTPDAQPARIPSPWARGSLDDPLWEDEYLQTEGTLHNFSFTSEIRFWGVYDPDDVPYVGIGSHDHGWAFINGRIAAANKLDGYSSDAGGVSDRDDFALEPGQLFELSIFLAQRTLAISSLYFHVGGMVPKSSVCTPSN